MNFKKIIIFALFFFIFKFNAYASSEFDTSYVITYTVNQDASVSVDQEIKLTNKVANVYASEYQISLGTTKTKDFWAKQDDQALAPQIDLRENTTQVKVNFVNKVLGKGRTLNLSLGYTSDDYAMKNGRVLEIGIPRMADAEQLTDYQVNLFVPKNFEDPVYIYPKPASVAAQTDGKMYHFSKNELLNDGVSAAFGNYQVFDFNLRYHLLNPNVINTTYEIALPPDTSFQKVYYDAIQPQPQNIRVDKDGNWLASFEIKPKENLEVIASGQVKIYIAPQSDFPPIVLANEKDYLLKKRYWETDNPEIIALAQQLKTPQQIYKYLVSNLIYDYAKVNNNAQRMGAAAVLQNKNSAICMEFTDLFVALARAAGIPSREVNGFAFTNNPKLRPLSLDSDVLHAWPQYYDKERKLWISVDPTWGNTTGGIDFFNKLDLNHFTFVFHGLDSELPLAAGSYKDDNTPVRDINVSFGFEKEPRKQLEVKINFPKQTLAGLPLRGEVIIKNLGDYAVYDQNLSATLQGFKGEKTYKLAVLPPFSNFNQIISFPKSSIFYNGPTTLSVQFDSQVKSANLEIRSFLPKWLADFLNRFLTWVLARFNK